MPLKILIVEDDPIIAEDLAGCLALLKYEVNGIAYSSKEALSLLSTNEIDLAILDINLGVEDSGIQLASILNQEYLIPFIFLTAYSDDLLLKELRETLPAGFILKPFDQYRIKAAIEIARHTYYQVTHAYWHQLVAFNQQFIEPLTERELELLQQLCRGLTNKEIGKALFISVNTVKTHLKSLYLKMDVRNRSEVIVKVQGWIK